MKKLGFLAIASVFTLVACEEEDNNTASTKTYAVQAYSSAEVSGNVVVINKANASTNQVVVKGNPELIADFEVRSEGGVLYVSAKNGESLSDSIYVEIANNNLTGITLNAQQEAVYRWAGDENETPIANLDIVTKGGSKLWFYGLYADNVTVETKGNSDVYLNSLWTVAQDSLEFDAASSDLQGGVLINNGFIYTGNRIETVDRNGNQVFVIYGSDIRGYYLINTVDVNTVGNTTFNSLECPINNLDINLTGNSTGSVWVLETLSGNADGNAVLNYQGDATVNFATSGSATVVPL
jgi:hypothetical protein